MMPSVALCVGPRWNPDLKFGRGDWIRTSDPLRPSGNRRVFRRFSSPSDLAELGLIDQYQFVVHPRLAGHGPTLFAGLSKRVDLKLVDRLEFGLGAVAMRYEPRR